MSGNNEYDDFDDFDDEYGEDARPSRDNNVLRTLRKEVRSKDKTIKELQEKLNGLSSMARERSVKDVLTAKGLSPKISRFIPEDLTSEEEVSAWVDENGDVFGFAGSAGEGEARSEPRPDLSALTQISQMQSSGQSYDGDGDQVAALIRAARTPEELNTVLFGSASGPEAF